MGKQIKILEKQISGDPSVQSPSIIELPNGTVSVAITNMPNSNNELLIGWGENPSTKNFLMAGQSRPYGPYNEGQYLVKQSVKFAFSNIAGGALNPGVNQALVTISIETQEEDC